MKIHPVGAELFHADRQTDMTQLTVAFAFLRMPLKIRWYDGSKGGGLKYHFA